jgi:1-deoxy-D-xylulose-5-phosphate reductoisomerase
MKKKIAILGSTGSIGKNLIKIIEKDKSKFDIVLLSANKNYSKLYEQAKKFNVKNIIILDKKGYEILKNKKNDKRFKIYNSFDSFDKIFKRRIDYTMSSIIGLSGLAPTLGIMKYTKTLAIANKESIICGWNLLTKEIKKNKVKFIPVDSEHFSIWYALQQKKYLEKIILTASGGPFNNLPISKFKNIKISDALDHPNWKMGNKITIDSSTMMNKVFEIIEAKKIFNLEFNNLSILIHPKSYIHAIIKFKNGLIKIIAHDTDMKIPIHNTLYSDNDKEIKTENININKLNNPNFQIVNPKKFPLITTLKFIPKKDSLFETILVTANDEFVSLFLKKKITFNEISYRLLKFLKKKEFNKYKIILPSSVDDILRLNKYIKSKINSEVL